MVTVQISILSYVHLIGSWNLGVNPVAEMLYEFDYGFKRTCRVSHHLMVF